MFSLIFDYLLWNRIHKDKELFGQNNCGASSEFVSSSIPSWQILTAIQRGQGSGFLSEGSSWLTACMSEQ